MTQDSVVLRFDEVIFNYGEHKPILDEASFSVRSGSKIALMGQNGAGKTSLFNLILGLNKPVSGGIFITPPNASLGLAKQVIAPEHMDMSVRDWFASTFPTVPHNLDGHI